MKIKYFDCHLLQMTWTLKWGCWSGGGSGEGEEAKMNSLAVKYLLLREGNKVENTVCNRKKSTQLWIVSGLQSMTKPEVVISSGLRCSSPGGLLRLAGVAISVRRLTWGLAMRVKNQMNLLAVNSLLQKCNFPCKVKAKKREPRNLLTWKKKSIPQSPLIASYDLPEISRRTILIPVPHGRCSMNRLFCTLGRTGKQTNGSDVLRNRNRFIMKEIKYVNRVLLVHLKHICTK